MVGQYNLKQRLSELISNKRFPRFIILSGAKGSGKKMLSEWIAEKLSVDFLYFLPDIRMETVRKMINDAYTINGKVLFVIPDASNMSIVAQNALLKITEEPPKQTYFIMTVEDHYDVLETLRSRATGFSMERYTPSDIDDYINTQCTMGSDLLQIIHDLCETPGDVNLLVEMNVHDFYDYVQKVVDNIATVSGANVFKVANKLAIKDDNGYDLKMFWKAFIKVCVIRGLREKNGKFLKVVPFTGDCIKDLRIRGINKSMLFDRWLLGVRKEWM